MKSLFIFLNYILTNCKLYVDRLDFFSKQIAVVFYLYIHVYYQIHHVKF